MGFLLPTSDVVAVRARLRRTGGYAAYGGLLEMLQAYPDLLFVIKAGSAASGEDDVGTVCVLAGDQGAVLVNADNAKIVDYDRLVPSDFFGSFARHNEEMKAGERNFAVKRRNAVCSSVPAEASHPTSGSNPTHLSSDRVTMDLLR